MKEFIKLIQGYFVKETKSAEEANLRLNKVISKDRLQVSSLSKEKMNSEIVEILNKYGNVEDGNCQIDFTTKGRDTVVQFSTVMTKKSGKK